MQKIVIFLGLALLMSCFTVSVSAREIKGDTLTYKGKDFVVSAYNLEEAMEVLSTAKKVYAMKVADVHLNTGNSLDFCECFVKLNKGKYAVEVYYHNGNYKNYVRKYIIFSEKRASVKKHLPKKFMLVTDFSCDHISNKDTQVAGYANAYLNNECNSFVVYI